MDAKKWLLSWYLFMREDQAPLVTTNYDILDRLRDFESIPFMELMEQLSFYPAFRGELIAYNEVDLAGIDRIIK